MFALRPRAGVLGLEELLHQLGCAITRTKCLSMPDSVVDKKPLCNGHLAGIGVCKQERRNAGTHGLGFLGVHVVLTRDVLNGVTAASMRKRETRTTGLKNNSAARCSVT